MKLKCVAFTLLLFYSVIALGKLKPLTVALDWFVNPTHVPLFVAKQQGYYKKFGIKVTFITPTDPSDAPKWVATKKVDLGIDYQPHLLLAVKQELPLVQVGTLINQPLACLVVLKSSGIQSIKQLKHQIIGYTGGETDKYILKKMLAYHGLSLKDVTLVNVHYGLTQALLTHKITAAMGMSRNFELIQLKLLGQPGKAFYPENHGVAQYAELVFIANRSQSNDPRIQRFLKALKLGISYLRQHPNIAWQQFAIEHPELNNTLNYHAWLATLRYF